MVTFLAILQLYKLGSVTLSQAETFGEIEIYRIEGVKAIRGVNSDGVIASLVDKGLVREAGRDPQRAQAIRYATTQAFLERFGLKSLRELPDLEQFAPDEESKKFIRERLSGRVIESTLEEAEADFEEERELLSDDMPGDATDE